MKVRRHFIASRNLESEHVQSLFRRTPATTENCAPFGNAGGAGPHFSWSAETAICSSSAIAKTDAEPTSKTVVSKIGQNMSGLPNYSLCMLRLPQRQPKNHYLLLVPK